MNVQKKNKESGEEEEEEKKKRKNTKYKQVGKKVRSTFFKVIKTYTKSKKREKN